MYVVIPPTIFLLFYLLHNNAYMLLFSNTATMQKTIAFYSVAILADLLLNLTGFSHC